MNYPSLVSLREVAPRDGWQKFKTVLPTEVKRELICSMIDYGARELEIGVFSSDPVRGPAVPGSGLPLPNGAPLRRPRKGVRVTALVESVEAARRASTLGIRHVDFFLSVSDTFGRGFGSTPWRPSPPLKPSPASRISRCKRPWARSSAVPSAMPPLWRKPWPMPASHGAGGLLPGPGRLRRNGRPHPYRAHPAGDSGALPARADLTAHPQH